MGTVEARTCHVVVPELRHRLGGARGEAAEDAARPVALRHHAADQGDAGEPGGPRR